jgi:hypothetical protein
MAATSGAEAMRLTDANNAAQLEIELKVEEKELKESRTGQGGTLKKLTIGKSGTVKIKLTSFDKRTLALALYGEGLDVAGSTVTDEPIVNAVAGGSYPLKGQNLSAFSTLKDSAGTPKTLAKDTDYTVDLAYGRINILETANTATLTLPLKATYTTQTVENVTMFTKAPPERFLRLEGVNVADDGKKVLTELYKVSFTPLKNLSLITDDFGELELEGTLLLDDARVNDPALGGFGRMVFIN